jgi:predicted DNA-binding transcriptional regulator YafY
MRADRLLEIILLLQARGRITAGALARELGVSERTIYRDLDALSAAGIPVYALGGPGGGCELPEHYRTLLTGVSPSDIAAVLMATASGPLADLGLDKRVQAALHKLVAALPATQRQAASMGRQRLHLDSAAWFRRAEQVPFLPVLQEGIETERYIQLRYRGTDEIERARLLAPFGLVAKASVWYVVGLVDNRLRVYRVSRILEATATGQPFVRPPDFDLPSFWAAWCATYEANLPRYKTTLQIRPDHVPNLQSNFSTPIVAISPLLPSEADGGWPSFEVIFETFEMARSWILGCGPAVKILTPLELKECVSAQASEIAALYA